MAVANRGAGIFAKCESLCGGKCILQRSGGGGGNDGKPQDVLYSVDFTIFFMPSEPGTAAAAVWHGLCGTGGKQSLSHLQETAMSDSPDNAPRHSPLDYALRMVEATDGCECALVPTEPSEDMMRIGATVGGLSLAQARAIYRAMLWAA